ncbi:MAG: LuxR C-terminal-related transcriptional regulator [Actinomycetota bacterium]
MHGSPIAIVAAKLRPPMLANHLIERSDLVAAEPAHPVALAAIVAPAGYGKTTVAAQTVAATGRPPAWLALEPADDDPVRFWAYVAAALDSVGVNTADAIQRLAAAPDSIGDVINALRTAIEAYGAPVDLVLDDLHVITDDAVMGPLGDLLRHPIPTLRIVATSRSELALPVGRLRAQGLLQEARVSDLAFAPGDAATLLATTFSLDDLDADELELVYQRTEGWPVGLYLAGISLRDQPDRAESIVRFAGDRRHLSEYLQTEVLDDLDADTRAFALATSIVGILDPDLCDHLTGHPGSLARLRRLLDSNVFINAIDESATTFRYHPLFQEHLGSMLQELHPELIPEFHGRASTWFEARGDNDRAIMHAARAGDLDRVAALITASWMSYATAGPGAFTALEGWVRLLGDRAGREPQVAMLMAWGMLNLGRYDELDQWTHAAQRAAENDAGLTRLIEMQVGAVRSHLGRHRGDIGEMVVAAEHALLHAAMDATPFGPEADSLLAGAIGSALAAGAAAAFWAGDLSLAHDRALMAVNQAGVTGEPSTVVIGYTYLALIAVERGDFDEAMAHADQALKCVPDAAAEQFHRPTLVHVARARSLRHGGRLAEALAAIETAERIEERSPEQLHQAIVAIERSLVVHGMGDRTAARTALRAARSTADTCPDARLDPLLRTTENAIRFTVADAVNAETGMPIGVRELTDKEHAVLALLPHGLGRRELAAQLHVSENTIKTHLTSIRHKLGVPGRGDVVERARQLGLLGETR